MSAWGKGNARGRSVATRTAVAWIAAVGLASAQSPQLLRDLNSAPPPEPSSWPSDFVAFGSEALFSAETVQDGHAVFRTDGSTQGTALFLDHEPGPGDFETRIWDLTPFGSGWIFATEHPTFGPEAWLTDGTPSGTRLLVETHPGALHAGPSGFTVLGNEVVFSAQGPAGLGIEPWISDGTAAGTRLLADLHPFGSSSPDSFHPVRGKLLFAARDGITGVEPWVTDGTPTGTIQLLDVVPGPSSSAPFPLGTLPGGDVVFGVDHAPASGRALWITDGTPAGTQPVAAPLNAVRAGTGLQVGNEVWFIGSDPVHGDQPWATDGTLPGTRRLAPFAAGTGGGTPRFLDVLPSGVVIARAYDRLYVTDGTVTGTRVVSPGNATVFSTDHARIRGALVFRASSPLTGAEPWITDGTPQGTRPLGDLRTGHPGSQPFAFTAVNGLVAFSAREDRFGAEPWVTDGTPQGTRLLDNLAANAPNQTADSDPETGVAWFGDVALLGAAPEIEPWRSDGTTAGTSRTPLQPNQSMQQLNENGNPRLHVVGDQLVLLIDDLSLGTRLWIDRGSGPVPGPAFATAPGGRPLLDSLVLGDRAWFSGQQLVHYRNGTTTPVNFGVGSIPWANQLTPLGQWAATVALVAGVDGLWRLDGANATLLHGFPASRPDLLTRARQRLFFVGDDGAGAGREIWSSDGTPGGTRVLDLRVGGSQSAARPVAPFGDQLLFQDQDRLLGNTLWLTDGTLGRTVPYDPFPAGTVQGTVDAMLPCGPDRYAFVMDDGIHGREPWILTPGGAHLVADLLPGSDSSQPELLGATGEEFWIHVDEPAPALWRSDGTLAGTTLVLPGDAGRTLFVESGGRLYVDHDDGVHGREPWVVRTGATASRVGLGCGVGNRVAWLESGDPVLGRSCTLRGGGGPAGGLGAVLLGVPAATPAVLGSGCVLHLRPAGFVTLRVLHDASQPWSIALPLPNAPALDDLSFVVQQASGPSTNALGFELGEAIRWTLGVR